MRLREKVTNPFFVKMPLRDDDRFGFKIVSNPTFHTWWRNEKLHIGDRFEVDVKALMYCLANGGPTTETHVRNGRVLKLAMEKGLYKGVLGVLQEGDILYQARAGRKLLGVYDTAVEAALVRAEYLETVKQKKKQDHDDGEDDVEYVATRTVEERNREGQRNAILLDED